MSAPVNLSHAENAFAFLVSGFSEPPFARLIFAALDDGSVVWSGDRMMGGPPYFTSSSHANGLSFVLGRLENDGLFSNIPVLNGAVPSSICSQFIVRKEGVAFEIESAHEHFERAGSLIAERDAIVPLSGRTRLEAIATQENNYLFTRMIWLELRIMMESMVPNDSRPCHGDLEMVNGEFVWRRTEP